MSGLEYDIKGKRQMNILHEVRAERERQDKKWGEQNHNHVEYSAILGEEYGEVCKASLEVHFGYEGADPDEVRKELIQTAAVAVAFIECIDRRKRNFKDEP